MKFSNPLIAVTDLERSKTFSRFQLRYVHPLKEHRWGQRVVRFYDPDGHIIEVGESLAAVCRRFLAQGMTPEEIALRMDIPLSHVLELLA